jgi:hypothetical protein
MTALTDYTENEIIKHIFRTGSFTKPTAIYIGLMSAAAAPEAGTVTELTGNGYARVSVAPLDANWAAPSAGNGTTSNVAAITFPTATADWATATHFGIWDASTAGNLLVYATLTASRTVTNGSTASFAIGALTFQIDN